MNPVNPTPPPHKVIITDFSRVKVGGEFRYGRKTWMKSDNNSALHKVSERTYRDRRHFKGNERIATYVDRLKVIERGQRVAEPFECSAK